MSEINRLNGLNGLNNIQSAQTKQLSDTENKADNKEITNLAGPGDVVGRSQVNKADNLKNDINFMLQHPEVMEKTEAFFNIAYEKLLREDSPNAYEKAAAMATTFARELAGA